MIGDPQLIEVIAKLALNYGRTLGDDAVDGMVEVWREQVGNCQPHDVARACSLVMADPKVTRFPTVAEFRHFVVVAAQERRREKAAALDGEAPACLKCDDSGWVWAGTDDAGYEFVDRCPDGCLPPLPGATYRRHHRPRRPPSPAPTQQQLVDVLPDGVIEAQHRMLGESDARDPEF